jgi:hypothetical protein
MQEKRGPSYLPATIPGEKGAEILHHVRNGYSSRVSSWAKLAPCTSRASFRFLDRDLIIKGILSSILPSSDSSVSLVGRFFHGR